MSAAVDAGDQATLLISMAALTACFKGLSPNDDDMFDLESEDTQEEKDMVVQAVRTDPSLVTLRQHVESTIQKIVGYWNGDSEVADVRNSSQFQGSSADLAQSISSLIKNATLSASPTLVSLAPLPLLSLVTTAAERSPSALWFALASTLVLRINSPPSFLTRKKGELK